MAADNAEKIRRPIEYRPEEWKKLNEARGSTPLSRYVREAALQKAEAHGRSSVTLTLRNGGVCGHWTDADAESPGEFEVPAHLVELWNVQPGDEILHVRGDSMVSHGIPDEALLHMRPFRLRSPRDGQICAITALSSDGRAWGTVKTWHWNGERSIELKDGKGKILDPPKEAKTLEAVAFWTGGVIGLPKI